MYINNDTYILSVINLCELLRISHQNTVNNKILDSDLCKVFIYWFYNLFMYMVTDSRLALIIKIMNGFW